MGRRPTKIRLVCAVCAVCAVCVLCGISCVDRALPPIGTEPHFSLQTDERRLWTRAEDEQQRLKRSGLIYDDPRLNHYLNEVVHRLTPPEIQRTPIVFHVEVIKNPYLNAFAYPNGMIYVHTGILAHMDNEAQLATLLGHEMAHVVYRHSIKTVRTVKEQTALGTALEGVFPVVGLLGSLGATAAIYGYSRDLEREADQEGFTLAVRGGYDIEEGAKLFALLKHEIEQQHIKEPFFFGSHPRIQERIDSYQELIRSKSPSERGETSGERFAEIILPLLIENAKLDLAAGRFDAAMDEMNRVLARQPHHSTAHYLLGEVYRQRGGSDDGPKAFNEYRQAVDYDTTFSDPHRGLGLLYLRDGDSVSSREEFQRYLTLNPGAEDRAYIEQYLHDGPVDVMVPP